jgi:hypothetical protein
MKEIKMKKLLVIFSIAFLLLAGCEEKYYSVLITNDSEKTVSFTYNDSDDTLASKTSKTYEVKAYTQPPTNINFPGALSVRMIQKGDAFTFEDIPSINLNVKSFLLIDIKIKADNYIWDDEYGSTEFFIPKGEERNGLIYTEKPNFTTIPSYPAIIDWNFNDNTMYVIIR